MCLCVPVCSYVWVCANEYRCHQWPEKYIESLGAGITDGSELLNMGPPQKKHMALTAEVSFLAQYLKCLQKLFLLLLV